MSVTDVTDVTERGVWGEPPEITLGLNFDEESHGGLDFGSFGRLHTGNRAIPPQAWVKGALEAYLPLQYLGPGTVKFHYAS